MTEAICTHHYLFPSLSDVKSHDGFLIGICKKCGTTKKHMTYFEGRTSFGMPITEMSAKITASWARRRKEKKDETQPIS